MSHVVRAAKRKDAPLFAELWTELLSESHAKGGRILPTERSVDFFTQLMLAYAEKRLPGGCFFVEREAVTLWGGPGAPYDVDGGMTCTCFGTYVRQRSRKSGMSVAVREHAIAELSPLFPGGFEGSVLLGDEEGLVSAKAVGFEPVGYIVHRAARVEA